MPSPCYTCEYKDQDKNNAPCLSCHKKLEYAINEGMLPPQVNVDMKRKAKAMKELEIKERKPGQGRKRKIALEDCKEAQTFIKFKGDDINIYKDLIKIAKEEERTIKRQVIYFIKKGIEKYKEH